MLEPIISSQDIAEILASICRSAVQEAMALPMHELNTGDNRSVQSILQGTSVTLDSVARHCTTMFQCPQLSVSLTGDMCLQDWAKSIFTCWQKNSSAITFITSGSTGEPTLQVQETVLLWQEAQELKRTLLQDRKRVVSAAPCHHVYGFLFTILLPKVAGIPCVRPVPFPSKSFINGLVAGDFIVAFPLFWEGILKYELPFADNIHGSTSTAPCSPSTIHALLDAGLGRISNIYGSSETGGIGYQHHPDSPLTLFSFWNRREGTRNSWVLERMHPNKEQQPPVPMPDNISWLSSDTFRVLGRKDKIVQVGGLNVSLHKTTCCLCAHPEVKDCVVRLMRQEEGNRLKAFIIPLAEEYNEVVLRAALHQWCREKLRPAERPKKISFGTAFPKTTIGKAKDWN